MRKFQHNSTTLHFSSSGEGRPVLFLHGFLKDHSIWKSLFSIFPEHRFQRILVDLPCHGRSRFDGEICTMAQMAVLLDEFLREKKIVQPLVIGHSMGGYVALELLRLRTLKLTLLHSSFWEDSEEKKNDRNRVIEVVRKSKKLFLNAAIPNLFALQNRERCKAIIEKLIQVADVIPANEIAAATAGLRDRRSSHDVMNQNDIIILQGNDDKVAPFLRMKTECAALDRKPLLFNIENAAHMSIWEQPEILLNLLKEHVIE